MPALERVFNQFEAGLWILFALGFAIGALSVTGAKRRLALITATALLAFGLSDIVESQTGTWWTPWWLLVLKVACVITFVYAYLGYRRLQK